MESVKSPIEVRLIGSTTVSRFIVEWDDLFWSTFRNLGVPGQSPGLDSILHDGARAYLNGLKTDRATLFANPGYVVAAENGTLPRSFIRQARRAQVAFWNQIKSIIGGNWRTAMKSVNGLHRQFAFNGLLVISGKHIHPQEWPDQKEAEKPTPGTRLMIDRS